MAQMSSNESIQRAFPEHWTRISSAIAGEPTNLSQLFEDLSEYVSSLKKDVNLQSQTNSKKRKLEDEVENNHVVPLKHINKAVAAFLECNDVSVQVPVRKKMKVGVFRGPDGDTGSVMTLVNQSTTQIEYSILAEDVDAVFCLPTPDKQVRQSNFVFFPKIGSQNSAVQPPEQIVFTMNEAPATAAAMIPHGTYTDDTLVTATARALNMWLSGHGGRVVLPSAAEFASSIPQSHRKGEKAYHVRAHRGSKEGYLFFLENGIVFGFKKPLAFFPFSAIDSISYTSVLQRTFNLVIAAREGESDEVKEIEFSMLDQEDFAGIDAYIKKHGLNDASMAAQRRAKAYNVNKEKKAEGAEDANGGVEEEDGQTELQKAEQQLQDEEDELEEDYEVSGGESEGEGEDSEEEEEAYDDEGVDEVDVEHEDP